MTRSNVRVILGGFVLSAGVLGVAGLTGCASSGDSPWVLGYNAELVGLPDSDEVRIEPAPMDALEGDASLEGYEVIGISRFTAERQEQDPSDPEGPLMDHAMRIGATLVRVALRPAGTETRTQYIRTTTPGTGAPGGNIASGRPTATQRADIPYDVEVEVFDHVAVFYKKNE